MSKQPQNPVSGVEDDLFIKTTSDVFVNFLWASPGHEHFLLSFVNAVMRDARLPDIRTVKVLNPFNVKTFSIEKSIALDIRATDENGRIIDIEVQIVSQLAFSPAGFCTIGRAPIVRSCDGVTTTPA